MSDLVKDAARRRSKRGAPERKRIAAYKTLVNDIEVIAHRGKLAVATGQTLMRAAMRRSESPLARLKRREVLNVWELTAANEIVMAHCVLSGVESAHDNDLGIRFEPRTNAADGAAARRIDNQDRFLEWRADLAKTPALAAVVGVLLDERSMRDCEREHRWRNGTALEHLRAGLRHFAALRGNTPNGVKWRYTYA